MLIDYLFQNNKCAALYHRPSDEIIYDDDGIKRMLGYTHWVWNPIPELNHNAILMSLYVPGKSLDEVCPEHLREEFDRANAKMRAHFRAIKNAKIPLSRICVFDLIPQCVIKDYSRIRCDVMSHVYDNYPYPENYDSLKKAAILAMEISQRKLTYDENFEGKSFLQKVRENQWTAINYNPFGAKTGRFTTKKGSFPILTTKRENRGVLKPNNDVYLEIDYNAMDLRVLLGLLHITQPKGDVHEFNAKNLFKGNLTREESKKQIFAHIYNNSKTNAEIDEVYNRQRLLHYYWDSPYVTNPFNREIKSDEARAIPHLVQSTAADLFVEQVYKTRGLFEKSEIAFLVHDSVVFDFAMEEKEKIEDLIQIMRQTRFGKFQIKVSIGKNFGEMKNVGQY